MIGKMEEDFFRQFWYRKDLIFTKKKKGVWADFLDVTWSGFCFAVKIQGNSREIIYDLFIRCFG